MASAVILLPALGVKQGEPVEGGRDLPAGGGRSGGGGDDASKKPPVTMTRRIASGMVTGALGKVAVAPLILMKMRGQVQGKQTKGVWQDWKSVEGGSWRTPFKGTSLSVAKTMLATGMSLPLYHYLVEDKPRGWWTPLASAVAGNVPTLVVYPLDVWGSRWSTEVKSLKGMSGPERRAMMMATWHDLSSKKAWFRGAMSKMISATPFNAINGTLYGTFKDPINAWLRATSHLTPEQREQWVRWKVPALLAAGAAAGCTVTMTHPLDTIVRRIQVSEVPGMNFIRMTQHMWREAGLVPTAAAAITPESTVAVTRSVVGTATATAAGVPVPIVSTSASVAAVPPGKRSFLGQVWTFRRLLWSGFPPNLVKCAGTYGWRFFAFANLANVDVDRLARKASS